MPKPVKKRHPANGSEHQASQFMNEKQFKELKERVETAKADAQKAQGALEQSMETLDREFRVRTLEDAKKKLREHEKATETAQKDYEKAFEAYQEKWKGNEDELPTTSTRRHGMAIPTLS